MKQTLLMLLLSVAAMTACGRELELTPAKDSFGRSNLRNKNNGAFPHLVIGSGPGVRSLTGFDLSGVTNEITSAELLICMQGTNEVPVELVVAPMAFTAGNAAWKEGGGSLGLTGRNARLGEATFSWRAFRDKPWEAADGSAVDHLMDSGVWKDPVFNRQIQWLDGGWIRIPLTDMQLLETVRTSETPIFTLGLWGTSGNGFYLLGSKESARPPRLMLTLKKDKE